MLLSKVGMKVCLVTGRMDAGGVPILLLELMRRPAQGLSFCLAAPTADKPYGAAALELLGADACCGISHRAFRCKDVARLLRFLKREKVDLVSCEGKSGGLVGRIAAAIATTPCVYFYHGIHYKDYGPVAQRVYFCMERLLSLFTRAIVATSVGEREVIGELRLCHPSKVRFCENGVDRPEAPVDMPPCSNFLQFVHPTRFNTQKNTELLLDICDYLRSDGKISRFRFVVVGDGAKGARADFERQVAARDLKEFIVCTGFVHDYRPLLDSSHGLLSTSRWEGQPLSLLDCMAAHRCVIATDVVGHRGLIHDGTNGLLFADCDARGGATNLVKLLDSPEMLHSLANEGRALWKAKYSIAQCMLRRADLYRSVLTGTN